MVVNFIGNVRWFAYSVKRLTVTDTIAVISKKFEGLRAGNNVECTVIDEAKINGSLINVVSFKNAYLVTLIYVVQDKKM